MKKRRFSRGLIAVPLLLTGCGDDWGDKIEAFVDNEVHSLTVAIAQSELEVRWFDYFNGLTSKSILVVDAAGRLSNTEKLTAAKLETFADRELVLRMLDAADENSIQAAIMVRAALAEVDASGQICDSENLLHRVDVDSLGARMASQITLPKGDWYVELSCEFGSGGDQGGNGSGGNEGKSGGGSGCWKSLVSIVTAIFGADKQREQKDKANDAIARIPSKVVSSSEISQMSRAICHKTADSPLLKNGLIAARDALTQTQQNGISISKALVDMRGQLEAYQQPMLIAKVRDQTGIERTANEIVSEYATQRVVRSLDEQRKDLAAFEARTLAAKSCSQMLASQELYALALEEKRIQLDAAVRSGGAYGNLFAPLLDSVQQAQVNQSAQGQIKRSELCAAK